MLQVLQEAGVAGVAAVGRRRCSLRRTQRVLQVLQLLRGAVAAPAVAAYVSMRQRMQVLSYCCSCVWRWLLRLFRILVTNVVVYRLVLRSARTRYISLLIH